MAMYTVDSSERVGNGQTDGKDILLGAADPNGTRLFFTTNPGLESVVENELGQRLQEAGTPIVQVVKKPFGFGGQMLAECEGHLPSLEAVVLQMRSVHQVQIPLHGFALLHGEHDLRQIERGVSGGALRCNRHQSALWDPLWPTSEFLPFLPTNLTGMLDFVGRRWDAGYRSIQADGILSRLGPVGAI